MSNLNIGEGLALSFLFVAIAIIMYIQYQIRVSRLKAREQAVKDLLDLAVFENGQLPNGDGFIFATLWKLSDIIHAGQILGYELTLNDCIKIVGKLKRTFTKEVGINQSIIDMTIHAHCKQHATKVY